MKEGYFDFDEHFRKKNRLNVFEKYKMQMICKLDKKQRHGVRLLVCSLLTVLLFLTTS